MANKIKGLTIEIGGNTTGLTKALGGVNKQSKDLQAELRQVDRLLKLDPKNTELVAQKQKILAEAVENSRNKLDTLKEAQKQVQQQFDRGEIGEDQYRAFQREVVKAEQELSKFEKQLKDTGITADQVAKKLGDAGKKMTSMGKTMSMAVTAPIVAAGAASFKFAADLQDAMGASDQIFKDSSGSIKSWADNLESYYGIAETEALTYANTMGAMLQNIGGLGEAEASKQAQTLVELAGDLTAMFGGTTESAVQALTGALKGNNSMLDNYGMGVNDATIKAKALEMGIYDGTGALELQAKQAATLALIMEQTADAQGQAAREAEGASGATRAFQTELKNLATDIGEVLLPVLTPLMASLRDLIKRFGEMSPEMQKTIVIVAGLAAAIGPLLLLFGGMSSGVSAIIGVVTKLIPVISGAIGAVGGLSGAIAFITGPIGIAIAAIAAIIAIGVLLYKNWDKIKAKAGELSTNIKAKFEDIKQSITDKINAAKDAVWAAIEKIKSFFDFQWELPKLKLPHFNIQGSFSLNPPSIPKFGVDWYAQGGIFNSPSIIGVGEAGKEAVLPIDKIDSIIAAALDKAGGGQMVQVTAPIYLDGKEIAVVVSKHQHAQIKAANRGVGVLT